MIICYFELSNNDGLSFSESSFTLLWIQDSKSAENTRASLTFKVIHDLGILIVLQSL